MLINNFKLVYLVLGINLKVIHLVVFPNKNKKRELCVRNGYMVEQYLYKIEFNVIGIEEIGNK